MRLCTIFVCFIMSCGALIGAESLAGEYQRLKKLANEGQHKEAYEQLQPLILAASSGSDYLHELCDLSYNCIRRLNQHKVIDGWRDRIYAKHQEDWRVLWSLAASYMNGQRYGFLIKGEFQRGHHRGGGTYVQSYERDRVRALQLMIKAHGLIPKSVDANKRQQFYEQFIRAINVHGAYYSWKLQLLSDLDELPDYNKGHGYWGGNARGAPVDDKGEIVFFDLPESWEQAKNDGERWRWCLHQMAAISPSASERAIYIQAEFAEQLFGVQTMQRYGITLPQQEDGDEDGPWSLESLGEHESIARLAVGVRRFELKPAYNYIEMYKQLLEAGRGMKQTAANKLGSIFLNRRQYKKALAYYRQANNTHQIEQITGNYGQFEGTMSQVAGKPASLEYRFRNGTEVRFIAHAIKIPELLSDIKEHIKSKPRQLNWNKINLNNIGYRLIHNNQNQYLGEQVADWKLKLNPSTEHFDRNVTVHTPLQKAGAYLVTAEMKNGNKSHIVVWLNDTILLSKKINGQQMYYVADAETGTGIAGMNVAFFGYRQQHVKDRQYNITVDEFAEFSDQDGLVKVSAKQMQRHFQYTAIATDKTGRLAYLGFTGVWFQQLHQDRYQQRKVFFITDRPVYRPNQTVHIKAWIRNPKYDQADVSVYANKSVTLIVHNGKGEEIHKQQITTDAYGGLATSIDLPSDANLGRYSIQIKHYGYGGYFRVEEYKKPEFEVTIDAPKEAIALGETFEATVKATYYFGAPVSKGTLRFKVHRRSEDKQWYPVMPWDWFYGNGYWWFAPDYSWYPGFKSWGCRAPHPWWQHRHSQPPELVMDNEVELKEDGTFSFTIDSSLAKAMHSDYDHVYTITAEVVDQSRRTIVGTGSITAARQPFKVNVWTTRGYYRKARTIQVAAAARTVDGKPVSGEGILRLFKITYDKDNKPIETEVGQWQVNPDADGQMKHQLTAGESGQYKLSYTVTDKKQRSIEGAYLFNVIGNATSDESFTFNDLELIVDKQEYKVGEAVQLLVNTERRNQQVLLFVRASNGVYSDPQILTLEKRSTIVPIQVNIADMPNFFVEAICVSKGQVHTVSKEIIVPPASRVLDIEVIPSKERYQPGEAASVTFKVRDEEGRPFVGSTVISIYDKALEYISGGSNVEDIKAFFWKWRRRHYPQTIHNASMFFGPLRRASDKAMQQLGVFGHLREREVEKKQARKDKGGLRSQTLAYGLTGKAVARSEGAANEMMADSAAPMEESIVTDDAGAGKEQEMQAPTVRTKFADTALWKANLTTDENGEVTVQLDMPENLSTWKINVWGMGQGTRVGHGTKEVITSKNVIVRMQAPRFFVERDEVVLSANVHNYLDSEKQVQVKLELPGDILVSTDALNKTVKIAPHGEARVDWRVKVEKSGEAVIRMLALTDEESDAMEMRFPAKIHGIDKTESFSFALRPEENETTFSFMVPEQRLPERSQFVLRYSPSLAGAMIDALPYMLEYPYGCTEQTLNRFLPSVITQRILLDMGMDLAKIREHQNNLNAQEIGDPKERAAQWQRKTWDSSPVFDEQEMQTIVKEGVRKLTAMQLSDGGWGWFSGWGEHSTPHTTATVVHGLQIAIENKVAIVPGVLEKGLAWLRTHQDKRLAYIMEKRDRRSANNNDALVFMVLADSGQHDPQMKNILYQDRLKLSPYAQSMLGLAMHKIGDQEKWQMILRNLSQFLQQDEENQTAYLELPNGGYWWYWYGSDIETHAYYLKLLCKTDPKGKVASRLVKYILNNRKHASYWNSTRDTALCIEALADYMRASGEAKPDLNIEIEVNGKVVKSVKVDESNLFSFDNTYTIDGDALRGGKHDVIIRKTGTGPLYSNAYVSYFTKEDDIKAAGLEVKVERVYYKLIQDKDASEHVVGDHGQAVKQNKESYKRELIKNLDTLESGDLVEIELVVHSKNDYEYIAIEDFKAAGFEPVDQRSGYVNAGIRAYRELRDDRVTFFVQNLARGSHSLTYRMRAEIPGKFSALPSKIYAMYAPELRGNADKIKVQIKDKE